ncbi:MAG: phosphatidylglycerol lysyltransferase domain-containing protein [Candidatus Omnitrophica bacterium]|nr:phosphatidylglycerol lysyltransferase domain-containing protein [Candidatus Omnitrophota bacterium]MDD5652610.1 phosphatidylglycerol lysyltransferase domain-containing protein [Candidatus Omnitrophota bacterium]
MKLNRLTLRNKSLVERFLKLSSHELAVYSFADIYIWKGLFRIYWALVQESLCIFFKDNFGIFLYLGPLTKKLTPGLVQEIFKTLDGLNKNKEISRIENVEEKDLDFYRSLGLSIEKKSSDYLCARSDLAELKGNKFKSKRSSKNYFLKHNEFQVDSLKNSHRNECLNLYHAWAKQRAKLNCDHVYQGMLEDSFSALKVLLRNFDSLGCEGLVVKVRGKVRAFTVGYKLNRQTFCVLYEVADLSFKGIAQFIFQEFCVRAKNFKYINVMDDSGLKNLEQVKFSYKPLRLIPALIVKKNGQAN